MFQLAAIHFDFAAMLHAVAHFGHFLHAMSTGMASGG